MPTLDEARELVGRLSQRGFVVGDGEGVGGNTTSTFTDALHLVDATKGTDFYVRGRLVRTGKTGSTRVRKVAAYDPAAGKLTVTPTWGVAPADLEAYELWPTWDPEEVERAIIRVQRHMYALADVTIPGVASRKQYALTTAAAWLVNPAQVAQVELQAGTVAGEYDWPTLPTNRVRQAYTASGPALVLDLRGDALGAADTAVVRAWTDFHSLSPLALPTDTTAAPLDWLAWEAVYAMLNTPGHNLDDDLRKRAVQEVRRHREANTPNIPTALFDEAAPWGWTGRGYL